MSIDLCQKTELPNTLDPHSSYASDRSRFDALCSNIKLGKLLPSAYEEYTERFQSILQQELSIPVASISMKSRPAWNILSSVLKHQKDPKYLDETGINGCSHLYCAAALASYLKTKNLQFTTGSNEQKACSTVLSRLIVKVKNLLTDYIDISAYINSLKLYVDNEVTSLSLLQKYVRKKSLTVKELLVPLSYELPAPLQSHHVLGLLRETSRQTILHILDPQAYSDATFKTGSPKTNAYRQFTRKTSIDIENNLSLTHVASNICKIFNKQIEHKLEMQKQHLRRDEESAVNEGDFLKSFYAQLTCNGSPLESNDPSTPLDTYSSITGNVCVPQAFHNMLYQVAKEVATQSKLSKSYYPKLKNMIDDLFSEFSSFVTSKFEVS
jgi:hypothetical protein